MLTSDIKSMLTYIELIPIQLIHLVNTNSINFNIHLVNTNSINVSKESNRVIGGEGSYSIILWLEKNATLQELRYDNANNSIEN
jgi:hypothetical protein